ncbi:MAG: response regulator [Bacteroidales bacterium]|nr:response regulator [Bacteroidales bacterium]HPO64568.1 response regulator [Bacteroidales bacterium]
MDNTSKTILVIDDSTTNVVLLEAVLMNKGYTIDKAMNVKEAYEIMQKRLPQLILLDLLMPRINGFEFLQQLKNNQQYKDIPVIIVSALTDEETIQKTYQLGAQYFIKKPVDINQLIDIVGQMAHV